MAGTAIFRSTDTNAPILTCAPGSFLALLNAVLVNGYGSVKATAVIHSDGTTVANNDTITIDGVTYTWKTALTPAANEVLIGASAATNLSNLAAAISRYGTENTNYGTGTTQQTRVQVTTVTATDVTLTAFVGGSGGNSIALSTTATHVTVPANFSGGSGSNTIAALGWGSPFTGTNRAVYRSAVGVRHYLDIDDSGPNSTALGKNAFGRAYEVMTAVGTGTNPFPTTTQVATCVFAGKSTSLDSTRRPWILIGDDRTFYFLYNASLTDPPNLTTNLWGDIVGFGEFLSVLSGDLYRSFFGFGNVTGSSVGGSISLVTTSALSAASAVNIVIPRTYTGTGISTWAQGLGDSVSQQVGGTATGSGGVASFPYPNIVDGGLYANLISLWERGAGSGAAAVSGLANPPLRGYFRGLYGAIHGQAAYNDQDTYTGVGVFAGKTFMAVKFSLIGMGLYDTGTWAASS